MEGDSDNWDADQMEMFDFNPLPPYGGRPLPASSLSVCIRISIHSLRMEGDLPMLYGGSVKIISIHSLRMEGDII